jgi:hypothetical protein
MRTTLDLGPMFRHRQGKLRQVEHLAALIVQHRFPAQTAPAALRTVLQPVNLNVIGGFDPLQGMARMTRLAAGFATAGLAQTLGAGFAQSVAGGWLAAVGTVAGQLGFQLLNPLFQLHQTFLQSQDDIHQHFGMAAGQGQEFFTREQLYGHKTFRKSARRG